VTVTLDTCCSQRSVGWPAMLRHPPGYCRYSLAHRKNGHSVPAEEQGSMGNLSPQAIGHKTIVSIIRSAVHFRPCGRSLP